jgi:hypothetical protein
MMRGASKEEKGGERAEREGEVFDGRLSYDNI